MCVRTQVSFRAGACRVLLGASLSVCQCVCLWVSWLVCIVSGLFVFFLVDLFVGGCACVWVVIRVVVGWL